MDSHNRKLTITSIYRSPNTDATEYNNKLFLYLQNRVHIKNHIITGDININLLSNDDILENYKNMMIYFDFVSYINKYTRKISKTCLDHFFVKIREETHFAKLKSFIFDYEITDHSPKALTFTISSKILDERKKQDYILKKYINYKQLKRELENVDWIYMCECNDVNLATDYFMNVLNYYIDRNTKTVKCNRKDNPKKDWITKALLTSINVKNKMYKKLMQNPENKSLKEKYKK